MTDKTREELAVEVEGLQKALLDERTATDNTIRAAGDLIRSLGEYVRQTMHMNPEWRHGLLELERAVFQGQRVQFQRTHPSCVARRVYCDGPMGQWRCFDCMPMPKEKVVIGIDLAERCDGCGCRHDAGQCE